MKSLIYSNENNKILYPRDLSLGFYLNSYDDLQSNFQAGVNSVYNAVVAKGVTPASTSLSDIITGIGNINTRRQYKASSYTGYKKLNLKEGDIIILASGNATASRISVNNMETLIFAQYCWCGRAKYDGEYICRNGNSGSSNTLVYPQDAE